MQVGGWLLWKQVLTLPKPLYAPLMSIWAGLFQGHVGSPGRACLLGLSAPGAQVLDDRKESNPVPGGPGGPMSPGVGSRLQSGHETIQSPCLEQWPRWRHGPGTQQATAPIPAAWYPWPWPRGRPSCKLGTSASRRLPPDPGHTGPGHNRGARLLPTQTPGQRLPRLPGACMAREASEEGPWPPPAAGLPIVPVLSPDMGWRWIRTPGSPQDTSGSTSYSETICLLVAREHAAATPARSRL